MLFFFYLMILSAPYSIYPSMGRKLDNGPHTEASITRVRTSLTNTDEFLPLAGWSKGWSGTDNRFYCSTFAQVQDHHGYIIYLYPLMHQRIDVYLRINCLINRRPKNNACHIGPPRGHFPCLFRTRALVPPSQSLLFFELVCTTRYLFVVLTGVSEEIAATLSGLS